MKAELLRILREAGDYVSGQRLCEQFGVSRTAVWKVMNQLKEEGYEIESVKNKGYRIREIPDVLTAQELKSRLRTRWMGRNCIYLECVDSTNTEAKRLAGQGALEGTLVLAEEQTGGKGRLGRNWSAARGENVMMTLLLRPKIRPEHASMLTLLMAMAAVRSIRKETGLEAGIKWPNDVVAHGKKLCGILTEMDTEINSINYVVIGIGINVNQEQFPEEIRETAGSLYLELGKRIPRAELAAGVLEELERLYETFLQTEDLLALYEEYNGFCVHSGQEVRVTMPLKDLEVCRGIAEGINEKGELAVRKADGSVEYVYAGEVSVRGRYGYV